jgi:hypothetical protein
VPPLAAQMGKEEIVQPKTGQLDNIEIVQVTPGLIVQPLAAQFE